MINMYNYDTLVLIQYNNEIDSINNNSRNN